MTVNGNRICNDRTGCGNQGGYKEQEILFEEEVITAGSDRKLYPLSPASVAFGFTVRISV